MKIYNFNVVHARSDHRCPQQKQFRRLNTVVENLETLLFDAHKTKGWQWVHQEPMWVTWPMEKFGAPSVIYKYILSRALNDKQLTLYLTSWRPTIVRWICTSRSSIPFEATPFLSKNRGSPFPGGLRSHGSRKMAGRSNGKTFVRLRSNVGMEVEFLLLWTMSFHFV